MTTRTVFTALIVGISLNLSAQNQVNPTLRLASYKVSTPVVKTPNLENSRPFIGGHQLEIAENKMRKVFAELTDLGEGFYVPEMENSEEATTHSAKKSQDNKPVSAASQKDEANVFYRLASLRELQQLLVLK